MPVSDIRLHVSFLGHRKRRKLKRLLGAEATDYLIDFWLRTAQNHGEDGVLRGMDAEDIALEAGFEGNAEAFVEAMESAGFLEKNGQDEYRLPGWREHQPWVSTAKERSEQASKAAHARWKQKNANNKSNTRE